MVYNVIVNVRECSCVRIPVLLMFMHMAAQHGCQSLVLSICLPIDLWMLCRGESNSNLKQRTYNLEKC